MPVSNSQLSGLLRETADLMQILGHDPFKITAYARVARAIDDLSQDIAAIGPDEAKLTRIPGVGKGMAARIAHYITTGKLQEHDELVALVPPGVVAMLAVQGLGPKTVALFWKQAGVETIDQLRAKIDSGELLELPGMGKKKLENIKKSLDFVTQGEQRHLIGKVMPVAVWVVDQLKHTPAPGSSGRAVKHADFAGSLRRGKETIGDLDVLVAVDETHGPALAERFVKLPAVKDVLGRGPTKCSVRTETGLQIDLRIVKPETYGATLLYFTGSKEHNVLLRQRAIDRGLKLNEYGLFKGDTLVAGLTEKEIYKALGLAWIPPELREGRDEIQRAERNTLPHLVELNDIKAELHAHTDASDGKCTIRELVVAAIDRGFHTVAITDHSQSQAQANGLRIDRLEQHVEAIRAVGKEFRDKITVLAGSEVDILADGKLDYPNSVLQMLDIVVASPHAALTQEPDKATTRLLRAIENPYVTIMGHPTGRILLKRPGLSPDMPQIIKAAAERGIALEINANYYRLDLRDAHARTAIEAGVKLAINTDAHDAMDLDLLRYGVLTARRAGATKNDVVNTMDAPALRHWIKSTRSGA